MKYWPLVVIVLGLLACGPADGKAGRTPQPTECLKHEKSDGSIEELCTSAYPEPMPTPIKIRPAIQDRIDEYKRQGGAGDEASYFPVRVIPRQGQRDNLIAWLESLGHKAREPQYGDFAGEFVIQIKDPLFLEQLAEREDVDFIDGLKGPRPTAEPDP